MANDPVYNYQGPFRAEHLSSGDPYELSSGHPIHCMPTGGRGSRNTGYGLQVLETDPDVESAGVDTGFAPAPDILRAPDVAVGNVPNAPGWVAGVPPLAVEYADTGQNEDDLAKKIKELFAYGTKYIWVVRLNGPYFVEVYEAGKPMYRVLSGQTLTAPGVLRNPVPVDALYNREVAHEVTLRNLLQRQGYESVEAIKAKSEAQGLAKGAAKGKIEGTKTTLKRLIKRRFKTFPKWAEQRIETASIEQLEAWTEDLLDATDLKHLLG